MKLTADYHTHTRYSHGKSSVLENAIWAKDQGLKEIAITDHGFSHPAFGLKKGKINPLKQDCKKASLITGVKVYTGIESNLTSINGDVDLKPKYYEDFEVFLVGIHKLIVYKPGSYFNFSFPTLFCSTFNVKPSNALVKRTTKALINAIKKNPIDMITHVNFCSFCDPVEVVKAAADYGTYIEISAKKEHVTDEQLYLMGQTGARFLLSSDAHKFSKVGDVSLAVNKLSKIDFPLEKIDNIDGRLPDFRFKNFKEKSL